MIPCLLSAAVFRLGPFLFRISVVSALWLTVLLILYVNLLLRPQEALNREKARLQTAVPVSAQVISVTQTAPDVFSAVLKPDDVSVLPAELRLDFRSPVAAGQRVKLLLFPDSAPPVVMTKDDLFAYGVSLEQQQSDLRRRKRFFRVLFVIAVLLAALGIGFRAFLSAIGAI